MTISLTLSRMRVPDYEVEVSDISRFKIFKAHHGNGINLRAQFDEFTDEMDKEPRLDAKSPEKTWWEVKSSKNGVVRDRIIDRIKEEGKPRIRGSLVLNSEEIEIEYNGQVVCLAGSNRRSTEDGE